VCDKNTGLRAIKQQSSITLESTQSKGSTNTCVVEVHVRHYCPNGLDVEGCYAKNETKTKKKTKKTKHY
jgi:hypothetical protein